MAREGSVRAEAYTGLQRPWSRGAQVTEIGKLWCGSEGATTAGALGTAAVELDQGNSGLEGGGSGSFRARWGGSKMWSGLLAIPPMFI